MKNNNWYNHVQSQRDNFHPITRYLADTARDKRLVNSAFSQLSHNSTKVVHTQNSAKQAQDASNRANDIKYAHMRALNHEFLSRLEESLPVNALNGVRDKHVNLSSPNSLSSNPILKKIILENMSLFDDYNQITNKISNAVDPWVQQYVRSINALQLEKQFLNQFDLSDFFNYPNGGNGTNPNTVIKSKDFIEDLAQEFVDNVSPLYRQELGLDEGQGDQGNTPPPVINAQNNANADHPVISRFEQDNIPHDAGDDQTNPLTTPPNTQIGNSSDQPPSSDDTFGTMNTARANRILNNPNKYPSDVNQRAADFFKDQCNGYRVYFDEIKKPVGQRDEDAIQRAQRDINEYEDTKDRMLGRKPVSNAQSSEQEQKQEEDRPANVAPQQQQNAGQNNPTIEELMARIRELEAENAELKQSRQNEPSNDELVQLINDTRFEMEAEREDRQRIQQESEMKNKALEEKDNIIADKDNIIADRDDIIVERDSKLREQKTTIDELKQDKADLKEQVYDWKDMAKGWKIKADDFSQKLEIKIKEVEDLKIKFPQMHGNLESILNLDGPQEINEQIDLAGQSDNIGMNIGEAQ